ncbi:helix-turn-helix domain-containing protein [Paenibacillus ferrarius]|uniref:helix-turn-helix domain-containing protein n=1 Tax=Paenibacillus ferrarius TaxID=1469647 RepID=UPI003D27EE58
MHDELQPICSFLHKGHANHIHTIRHVHQNTKSITQIALETGFQTSSYFIKHFNRNKGVSPKRYRKERLHLEIARPKD